MKDGFIKVAAASPELRVADCEYNTAQAVSAAKQAAAQGVAVLVLPELCISGYTVGDLLFQRRLQLGCEQGLKDLCESTAQFGMLIFAGSLLAVNGKIYNCAVAMSGGHILGVVPKTYLPSYAEFYEKRWFSPPPKENIEIELCGESVPFGTKLLFCCRDMAELCVAAEVCEDIWVGSPPSEAHCDAGATVCVNLSASNDIVTKADYRRSMITVHTQKTISGYIYCSAGPCESSGDLVFGGHKIVAQNGRLIADSGIFGAELTVTELDVDQIAAERRRMVNTPGYESGEYEKIYFELPPRETSLTRKIEPLVFVPQDAGELAARCRDVFALQREGLMKRVRHIGAPTLVLGVSGGLDSTLALLVCCAALDKLGRPRTQLVAATMPCFGTSARTKSNAQRLCETLGCELRTIDISEAVRVHLRDIGAGESERGAAYENAQARERTQVLMDIANLCGGIVVGTGDLSESALGWCTYNGDQMSMYNVNASVPKTLIAPLLTQLCAAPPFDVVADIVADVCDTPVSPELLPAEKGRAVQRTEDSVGPYELVDFFIYYMLRWGFEPKKIVRMAVYAFGGKYDEPTVKKWLRVFYKRFFANQFKRSAMPDGPKVGSAALSPRGDWRMPSDASAALWLSQLDGD